LTFPRERGCRGRGNWLPLLSYATSVVTGFATGNQPSKKYASTGRNMVSDIEVYHVLKIMLNFLDYLAHLDER